MFVGVPISLKSGSTATNLSGFAQWCQFSVWGHGGGQRTTPAGALGSKGMA